MENNKEQERKAKNKVYFTVDEDEKIRASDDNSLPELIEQTSHQISSVANLRIQQSSDNINIDAVKQSLSKLFNFLKFHGIEASQVWKSKKRVTLAQFENTMSQNFGYELSNSELTALLKIANKKSQLCQSDFQAFQIWNEQSQINSFSRYLQKVSSQNNSNSQSKAVVHSGQNKSQSKNVKNAMIYKSRQQGMQIPQNSEENVKQERQTENKATFDDVKKYSEAKVKNKMNSLKQDIKESVLQKKWDFIVMAGQMNQWIEQLKKQCSKSPSSESHESICSFRFKIINKDPVEIIQQNIQLNTEEKIPQVVFVKKYQTLKKRMIKEENNKNNLKGTVLMVLEENDKFSKNNLISRINQRDQELNLVLLQIMRMKSLFQWQNNILKEAKINF